MIDTLLNVALVIVVLGVSALLTYLFARAMYITCPNCRTLNVRHRRQCRNCGEALHR